MARKDALGQIRKAPRKAVSPMISDLLLMGFTRQLLTVSCVQSKSVKAQKKQWLQDLVDRDEELESSGEVSIIYHIASENSQ